MLDNGFHSRRLSGTLFVIFALTITIRLGLLFTAYRSEIPWRGEVERIAVTLADTGEFADPYILPTGSTAHNPPALPFLFSLIFRAVGTGTLGFAAKCTFIILCYGVLYALLPRIAVAFGLPLEAGLAAAFTAAIIPFRRTSELYMAWDEPITAMLFAAAALLTTRFLGPARFQPVMAALYGALWGVIFHFFPAMLPVYLLLLLLVVWRRQRTNRPVLLGAAVSLIATAAVILPWTIRNHEQMGAWMFMRSNFGLELRLSNNDIAGPTTNDNNDIYRYFHPGFGAGPAREVQAMGEVAFHRRMQREAISWIRAHPGRFASLTARRFLYFWTGPPETIGTTVLISLVTLAGFIGMGLLWRDGYTDTCLVFLLTWISFPFVYYFIQINQRYRVPIEWTVLLCAGYAAWVGLNRPVIAWFREGERGRPAAVATGI